MAVPESNDARARRLARTRDIVVPFARARRFYSQAEDDDRDPPLDKPPVARPTIALARQVFHDEIVLLGLRMFLPAKDRQALERNNREVGAALDFYRPEIEWYQGGHTGFIRSRPVQEFIDDTLIQSGLVRTIGPG